MPSEAGKSLEASPQLAMQEDDAKDATQELYVPEAASITPHPSTPGLVALNSMDGKIPNAGGRAEAEQRAPAEGQIGSANNSSPRANLNHRGLANGLTNLPVDKQPNGIFGDDHASISPAFMLDFKNHMDQRFIEMKDQSRRDFERVLYVLQQESNRRTALEHRMHSQMLMQSESMVAMELKLLRLEAKLERREAAQRQQLRAQQRSNAPAFQTIDEHPDDAERNISPAAVGRNSQPSEPTNIAVFTSGASLASGVTAGSFIGDGDSAADDQEEVDSQRSTPTQGSRTLPRIMGGTLESILLNPMFGESGTLEHSVRATRGDTDGNSSLGTSITNSTLTSTIVTATTRDSNTNAIPRGRSLLEVDPESRRTTSALTMESDLASSSDAQGPEGQARTPRSRSNSPLTVQSYTDQPDTQSVSSASQSTTIMSSAAVAPRSRRHWRTGGDSSRPLANRVVSFSTDMLQNQQPHNNAENCDSITMPDELDNLSEVADNFASSARLWREEYEARLDALQKRYENDRTFE